MTDSRKLKDILSFAIAKKIAALATIKYLEKRAKRGSREKLLSVLHKAADIEPEEFDKLS